PCNRPASEIIRPRPERWASGRRRSPAKGVYVKSVSWVRIPSSPPSCFALMCFSGCPPKLQRRRASVFYVYLIGSLSSNEQRYVGMTTDLERRLQEHNDGKSYHTSKFKPWRLVTYVAFSDRAKAESFERYLKSGSGHAFASKRLW